MTIEEKVKAYDEALERARTIIENKNASSVWKDWLCNTFPELQESDGERIRQQLLYMVKEEKEEMNNHLGVRGMSYDDMIAWLEKQGEPVEINPSEFDLRLNKLLKQFKTLPKEELESSLSFYLNVIQNDGTYKDEKPFDYEKCNIRQKDFAPKSAIEAIHEVRVDNANKVESKFKVKDWVVYCGKNYQITSLNNNIFTLTDCNGSYFFNNVKSTERPAFHLWTIKDAKVGDVLADNGSIFLFKEEYMAGKPAAYCGLVDGVFHVGSGGCWTNEKCYPATKEQCDTLMKAMTDVGYTFDFKKKELKKIPNALEECEIEHIEHGKYYYCIKDYYSGGCKRVSKGEVVQALRGMSMIALGVKANEYFIPVKCIVDNKPAWSEEDEDKESETFGDVEQKVFDELLDNGEQIWSEDDENNLQGIIDEIEANKNEAPDYDVKTYNKFLKWLKSLKQRLNK